MNYITKNFTYEELIHSNTASRLGINNTPNEQQKTQLILLAETTLQPIRDVVGPLHVSSGFRCLDLNRAMGSKDTSQHIKGQAADIWASNYSVGELFFMIPDILRNEFDQMILEYDRWIHISRSDTPRRQRLTCTLKDGKPHYELV